MICNRKKIDRIINTTVYVENHGYLNEDVVSFNNLKVMFYLIGKNMYLISKDSFQIDLVEPVTFVNGFVKEHNHINILHVFRF